MKHALQLVSFLALALFAGPALAAEAAPGFWVGYLDGFLSLLKLLASPILDVTPVTDDLGPWAYAIGYYAGLLSFAGAAGAAASSADPAAAQIDWA